MFIAIISQILNRLNSSRKVSFKMGALKQTSFIHQNSGLD